MILALLLGCAGEPVPADTPAACAPDPDVTWETFGAGFFAGRCAGCHGADAPDRFGAPAAVVLDTEADVIAHRDAVARTVLTDGTMPPAGGLTDTERARLAAWLACP